MATQPQPQKGLTPGGVKPQDHLVPVRDLSKIFPDIEGELCSRHSTLFGKLKGTFNKLYDNLEPSHYIVVKGNTHIIGNDDDEVELSMGLENGVILLVAKTYPRNNIFLNGNHIDQQLILDHTGRVQEGLYELSQEIQAICQSALAGLAPESLWGGIIYVHANIPQGFYNYRNALLTALFLAMLVINGGLARYSVAEMVSRMVATKAVDQIFLEKAFYDYENRQFSLMVGPTMFRVPLDPKVKLLFVRLDLAHCDVEHSQTNIQELKSAKEGVMKMLQDSFGVRSFYQAFENQIEIKMESLGLEGEEKDQRLEYARLVESELKELRALCQYSNNNISVEDLLGMKWLIDSKMRGMFSQEVVDLVESIRLKTGINACTIVEQEYLMMAVDRRKYTELICGLRQLLNKGELKSKSCFKIEEELVENRWGSEDNGVGQKIFVSVPSKGVAVFDPCQAIWFD